MNTIIINPYLAFKDGQCKQAMDFYATIFEAEIVSLNTFGNSPMKDSIDKNEHDRILHGEVKNDWLHIMCCDVSKNSPYTQGNNAMICLHCNNKEEQTLFFNRLKENGKAMQPLNDFHPQMIVGMIRDSFGIMWFFHCPK